MTVIYNIVNKKMNNDYIEEEKDLWYFCNKCLRFHKNPNSKIYLEHLKYMEKKYTERY